MSRHRWTSADLARAQGWQLAQGGGADAAPNLAPRPNQAPGLNAPHDPLAGATQLERRYAAWLDQEQAAGRVVAWRYEPFRLVLSPGKRLAWLVDFGVVTTTGLELVETKPLNRKNGRALFVREDSKIKVKAAAELYRGWPFLIVVCWPLPGGGWGKEVL